MRVDMARQFAADVQGRGVVTPSEFITKWRASELKEGSASQEHFLDLTVLLNTPSLKHAYTSARESGRHFHLHPWRKVPIPRYDDTSSLHRTIAGLCTQAEKIATQTLAVTRDSGQVSLSKTVRRALADNGIAAAIDEYARELLPAQAD